MVNEIRKRIFSDSELPPESNLARKRSEVPAKEEGASLKSSQREETVEKRFIEERLAVGMSQLRG